MQSSATVTLRAFVMLACAVGIPVLAMSGASWSEILKKFQNLRWPAVVEPASASISNPSPLSEAPRFGSTSEAGGPQSVPPSPATAVAGRFDASASLPASSVAGRCEGSAGVSGTPGTASDFGDVPERLQQLGATYYVLESWGNDQQLYRFYCKMAVAGSADYTHCFEATDADPRQAMQQVLQQVVSWRQRTASGG
jgi:hypothetical protein